VQVDTGGLTPDLVADQIQTRVGYYHLRAMGEYDVIVSPGSLDQAGEVLIKRGLKGPFALVCDEHSKPYAEQVRESLAGLKQTVNIISLPAGEQTKTIQTVSRLWGDFLAAGLERGSTVVAVGGGVISDLAGFAASTYLRGIRWAAIPTTLLAMADASLGGKTGIDLPQGKNLAGAFHPPALVLQDPDVLRTLPLVELRSGMGEVLKHGVISDPSLWRTCVEMGDPGEWADAWDKIADVVRRAVAVKVKVIEADPYEKGRRAVLNFGHTIGHAIETLSEYGLRHGECVAIGMVVEAQMSESLGLAKTGLTAEIADGVSIAGLPTEIPAGWNAAQILSAMKVDKKKSGGKVKFALPVQFGEVREGMEVDDSTIEAAILSHTARS
jgi:3-dehydroquinate synthase